MKKNGTRSFALINCSATAADQLPGAEVLGVDLSPIQPKWVPSNCRFLVDDVEEEWLYGDNFDMVHMRTMASVLKDIPKVLRRAYKYVREGKRNIQPLSSSPPMLLSPIPLTRTRRTVPK